MSSQSQNLMIQCVQRLKPAVKTPIVLPQANAAITEAFIGEILDANPGIRTLKNLHCKITFDPQLCQSPSLGIKLMRAYSANAQPNITRQVFDQFPNRTVIFFNVMIRSYVNNHLYRDALHLFDNMSSYKITPDHYTFPCVLKACSYSNDLAFGLRIHTRVSKMGLHSNIYIGNGLISMYGKCNCLVDARKVLDEMPHRDVVSWNSMVAGYAQRGLFDNALNVCREMESLNLKFDPGTMASLSPAITNTSSDNVLFVKKMFMNLDKHLNLVSWNVMIAVYVHNSMPREAIELYSQMEDRGLEPDSITIASVLPACGLLSALTLGKRIHEYAKIKRFCPNLLLENALIDMYAKCGCLDEARRVFNTMEVRDVVSWTSMINAYGSSGQGLDAISLFLEMRETGPEPDSIAFISILSACSHSGLLHEGQHCFKLMTDEYKIVPRVEHLACMVDLLGRAGRVKESFHIIKSMNLEPNERIWGALLSACRLHSNMEIGLIAADKLFKLAPKQSGYYVLVSNIYAKACRWKDVSTIRSIMKSKGIKKMPGISDVEINNRVHTFVAGDQFHEQSKEIFEELDVLMAKMKEYGYVPETNFALHDVEEEDKENHLAVHSEKLAIVFALMNTKPGTSIRITKNLRVCGDCHVAVKLISKITEREIVLRDTNRFHHFRNGVCSCGDYW